MNLDTIAPEEVVDGFFFPAQLSADEKRQADKELAASRQERRANQPEHEKLYGQMLQLKIIIEDYIKQESFDPKKDFAYFLRSYVDLQPKKKKEIAAELDIYRSQLSQLLSGDREPSETMFIRLEFHSNRFIPAQNWFRLFTKKHEHNIMTNMALRSQERDHVKGHLEIGF